MLEEYAIVQEMARKRGVTERTLQTMCAEGKIKLRVLRNLEV